MTSHRKGISVGRTVLTWLTLTGPPVYHATRLKTTTAWEWRLIREPGTTLAVEKNSLLFAKRKSTPSYKLKAWLHDTGATFIPARVHSGSLLWLCIRLHDTNTKCHSGASHTGASSPQFLCRSEIFISARKFISVSCKRGMTVRFIFIKVSSILRHYKTRTPTNTALCKHGATFHLAQEWKSRRYHVNTP